MRILIVAPNISMRMGGEAVLAYHYVRELQAAGIEVAALTHARVRDELRESAIWREGAFHFVEDAPLEKGLHRLSRHAPPAIAETAFNSAVAAVTLRRLATKARRLAAEIGADIIHQPTPVSPQFPSFLSDMPAPVVMGPMNGGMAYPPAFEKAYSRGSQSVVRASRAVAGTANALFPGKLTADRLLVANERTLGALPAKVDRNKVSILVENGVDLDLWTGPSTPRRPRPTFVFVGRLVHMKATDLLIRAFGDVMGPADLVIIGDGVERAALEAEAAKLSASDKTIEFKGFRPQSEIRGILTASTALVLPSMRECGGAVVLEAFACRTPAIATDWGGPKDYITPETGFLVAPDSEAGFLAGLTQAMQTLADDPQKARTMGEAARARIEEHFSWRAKAAAMIAIYEDVLQNRA